MEPPVYQTIAIMAAGSTADEYEFYRTFLSQANYKIAADGGLRVFYHLQILPDLCVGDCDSVEKAEWAWAQQNHVPAQQFSPEKDSTDSELALDIAIAMKPQEIWLLGGIGSRLDHTLGNLYLLEYAYEHNATVVLMNAWHTVRLLTPLHPLNIVGAPGEIVSLIPITKTLDGVTLKGLHWELQDATLHRGPTLCLSNKLEKMQATMSLKHGLAFIIQAKEK